MSAGIPRAAVALLVLCWYGCRRGEEAMPTSTSIPFSDDFERADLGEHWRLTGGQWFIQDGALVSTVSNNAPLWLQASLPHDVEVSMSAWSESPEVDLKFEIFGDGQNHASGYVVILAGWKNSTSIIARLDEHGRERTPALTRQLQAEVERAPEAARMTHAGLRERISRRVRKQPMRRYELRFVRQGHWLRLYVDGEEHLSYFDPSPLHGPRNDRFAFNNWQAKVHFDDLKIVPLAK